MAEEIALGVQPQPAAQDKAHVCDQTAVAIELHALGPVTDFERVVPNPLVGIRADVLPLPVEDHGNQRLRNTQFMGDALLRYTYLLLHSQKSTPTALALKAESGAPVFE